jgi:hypothetical protein
LPLLFNFALEYTIRKVHVKEVALKLSGKNQLLVCADDINLLRDNISTMIKIIEAVMYFYSFIRFRLNSVKNSLTFTVYNGFIGLDGIATCFGL